MGGECKKKRNWHEINKMYVERGRLFFDFEEIKNWKKELAQDNYGKKGRPYKYPHVLIMIMAATKFYLDIGWRETEGAWNRVSEILKIPVPSFTRLNDRFNELKFDLGEVDMSDEDTIIVVDSTGIKKMKRGEWRKKLYKERKERKKREWVKLHVAIDKKTHKILDVKISSARVGDNRKFKSLIKGAKKRTKGKIKKVIADTAYDSRENYNFLKGEGIIPVIKPRVNSICKSKGCKSRAKEVRKFKEWGPNKWAYYRRYRQRWQVESAISAFKRTFGEHVSSKSFCNQVRELKFKSFLFNLTRILP